MKIFIVSPNANALFTPNLQKKLETAGEVILIEEIKPFKDVQELFLGTEDRILAIDPDFCDWKIPNEIIDMIPHLKGVCLQTTSFSWIDIDHAKQKGIPVMNLRGFSTIAVSEWATMMVLLLARKMPLVIKDGWKQDYTKHKGIELGGKIAGIVGLGRIGTAIAHNMHGLGMNVQYWSKQSTNNNYEKVSLEDVMNTSDVIIPAVARNTDTKGLITDAMIESMRKTAIFISIVHEVYNHELLLKKASAGEIFGYGFEESKGEFMKYSGNVWAGPELGWCTQDSFRKNGELWTESIIQAVQGNYQTRINQ